MPRFVTAVSRTGSRIHAAEVSVSATRALCRTPVWASSRQEFIHTETGTNCYLCCSRVERRLKFDQENREG